MEIHDSINQHLRKVKLKYILQYNMLLVTYAGINILYNYIFFQHKGRMLGYQTRSFCAKSNACAKLDPDCCSNSNSISMELYRKDSLIVELAAKNQRDDLKQVLKLKYDLNDVLLIETTQKLLNEADNF